MKKIILRMSIIYFIKLPTEKSEKLQRLPLPLELRKTFISFFCLSLLSAFLMINMYLFYNRNKP